MTTDLIPFINLNEHIHNLFEIAWGHRASNPRAHTERSHFLLDKAILSNVYLATC